MLRGTKADGGKEVGMNDPELVRPDSSAKATADTASSITSDGEALAGLSESARRSLLRELLRMMEPEVAGSEVDAWLRECGPRGAAIRSSLSSPAVDPRTQRNLPTRAPCIPERDSILEGLRQRNMVASNVGLDIIILPLEEKAAEVKPGEVLSNRSWLQIVRSELEPALRSSTLSRVSRDRRGRVWKLCARVAHVAASHSAAAAAPDYFQQLVAKAEAQKSEANDDIARDLGRSMPEIAEIASPEGQQRLRRCLSAYALHNPDLGYCQGMNFMAAVLQLHLPSEEDAFWCLDVIVRESIPGGLSRALTGFKV